MFRNFFDQPVNFVMSSLLVLSFGLFITSHILNSAGMDDPVTAFGEFVGGKVLDSMFPPHV